MSDSSESDKARLEFLQQLRLIYLSLVATCFLLLVGSNLQSSMALQNAFRDSESIRAKAPELYKWIREKNPFDLWSEVENANKERPAYISFQ